MKKILNLLYSTQLTAILFVIFAVAMGIATFIENDYGTQTSKTLIYSTWWFEGIMIFFVINFFGNIFRYRLHKKEKWVILLFHIAFLFILIGAGITRYIGFEGIMKIQEGQTTNKFLSETTYLNIIVDDNKEQKMLHKKILLSTWGKNNITFNNDFKGQEFNFNLVDYIPQAEKKLIEDENGDEYLHFVESGSGYRHDHYIKKGTSQNIHNRLVGFEAPNKGSINFTLVNDSLKMMTLTKGTWFRMADKKRGSITKDSIQDFKYLTLHNVADLQFVIPTPPIKGILKMVSTAKKGNKSDLVIFNIKTGNQTKKIELLGGKYNTDNIQKITIENLNFRAWYGSKTLETPFSVKLNDFQLKKYPGSESAMSYASEVTVIAKKKTFDYRIFMNHILNYKGYKLFQSSYDLSGEYEETRLSVNHDYWGTLITYIGYFMLFLGLILIPFAKETRFNGLKKTLDKVRKKRATLTLIFTFLSISFAIAQHTNTHQQKAITNQQIDSILHANIVDLSHAEKFNTLVIQDAGGRMKPVHTFASELIRKVSKKEIFKGMQPSQVLISIIENPRFWFNVPFIYLERGNTKIRKIIGISKEAKYAKLSDFFDNKFVYKLKKHIANAQKKKIKNKFENDFINIDKRVGLFYTALGGSIFRFFPIPNNENNKWVSQPETNGANFTGEDSVFVRKVLPLYSQVLQSAKQKNDYTQADKILEGIKKFQQKFGAEVYPSKKKIQLEIAYNKFEIFNRLAKYLGFTSLFLIVFVMMQIFTDKKWINFIVKLLIGVTIILFIIHTLGLASRWYISGNAPWSNAYESIIFVAWATLLFGLIFGKKSYLTIAATTFLTAIILAFAHQNWLDPQIANLQPVLNSWWLMVHVSIISASYGPFSLGMILGIFVLILTIFTTEKNKKKLNLIIKELTVINEMALTIGLIMLTIGNFLGSMWANESWGRYWGWDPKETWALLSIMVYAFVLHMRLIPGLRGRITFNFTAIFSYLSIMMTFFGVNFYLSGLHSYASGNKAVTPREAYYFITFLIVITILAWFKHKKYYQK